MRFQNLFALKERIQIGIAGRTGMTQMGWAFVVQVRVGDVYHSVVQRYTDAEVMLYGEKMLFEAMATTMQIGINTCRHLHEVKLHSESDLFLGVPMTYDIRFCHDCGETTSIKPREPHNDR